MCDTETNTVQVCPKGYYCPTGTAVGKQRPCLAGTYSPSTSLADAGECISCMPGYYCPQGSTSQIKCPRGSFCPKRTKSPDHHPCPGGTYNPSEMAIDIVECLPCPTGKYCPQGSSTPLDCPESGAAYCTQKAARRLFRLNNIFCGDLLCSGCLLRHFYVGTYSDGYGTKGPGPGSHKSMCMRCPAGYSCTNGTRTPCGPGKTSKEGDGICMDCPRVGSLSSRLEGSYCPIDVTTYDMLESFRCSAGMLCTEEGWVDLSKSSPCPKGHYCPAGAAEATPCPEGTFNPLERREKVSDCIISKAGTYAKEGTISAAGSGSCQKVNAN
ncbi:signal peptide, CUB and EGF-like domain-containing protein 2 [Cyclospora cayetanensis]|uniref:Signal peptide, CUB and EGF-like domain-containing protein 2 n=1 Tax=Cyclospora cayetanensis TaxID=88456 RepID=A0A6P6S1R6_9EIME|nr:signal peptide, CUB and EGF-like domain-containing protein 2 [Cyclospora cayetanensis]